MGSCHSRSAGEKGVEIRIDFAGDRLAAELGAYGANLEIVSAPGGRFVASDLVKLRKIFWRNNIVGFAPFLDVPVSLETPARGSATAAVAQNATLIGTWYRHDVPIPDNGGTFTTGVGATNRLKVTSENLFDRGPRTGRRPRRNR